MCIGVQETGDAGLSLGILKGPFLHGGAAMSTQAMPPESRRAILTPEDPILVILLLVGAAALGVGLAFLVNWLGRALGL